MTLFSRGHATLHLAVSASPSVRPSKIFLKLRAVFRIIAPAQPSATGLPCIRPCFHCDLFIFYVYVITGVLVSWNSSRSVISFTLFSIFFWFFILFVSKMCIFFHVRMFARNLSTEFWNFFNFTFFCLFGKYFIVKKGKTMWE